MSDRLFLQGSLVPRVLMAIYLGAIGIIGSVAGALHSDNVLKWVGSIALLVVGVAVPIRILTAGFIVSESGVRVRAVWRTWSVPWPEVYHVTIAPLASQSLTGSGGSLELTTTDGRRLRSAAITASKVTSPELVDALTSIEECRQRWRSAHPDAITPVPTQDRSPRAQVTVQWFPGTAEPPTDELWVWVSMRVRPGEATLRLAVGYTERVQPGSLRSATANPSSGDVTFYVHTNNGTEGHIRASRTDASLIAHELNWPSPTSLGSR
ncbi:hypothetical protein SAMN05444157_3589 [Frankineae bacterium MT45]|nr:hypothetical protein SAMN05444157_3589 [Frankineae bacterium MT45]